MASVDITITLQGGQDMGGYVAFMPGDLLQGTVTLYPDSDVNCRHVYVHIGWHTEGRGTLYSQKLNTQDLFQGDLLAGRPMSLAFGFQLPQEPWSYDGHYVSIVWDVTVQLDVPWKKDLQQRQVFVVRPFPQALAQSSW